MAAADWVLKRHAGAPRLLAAAERRGATLEALRHAAGRRFAYLEVPSDAELRAMRVRGELPGDEELARECP